MGSRSPEEENKDSRRYSAPAVDRTLDLLEFLSQHHRPFGPTELSRELGIPTNTVFRIMKRLSDRDYARQDPLTGGYTLSTRVLSLGVGLFTRFDLRYVAREHLIWLCRETDDTCQIQIPQGDRVLVLDTVNPETDFYLKVVPGSLLYYHPNAFGKAILAFLPREQIEEIAPTNLPRLTANTITLRDDLIKDLEQVRSTGIAFDNEEYTRGVYCIGSPVFGADGNIIAGLGITSLASWFDQKKEVAFERLVLECAHRVSKAVGYTGDFFESITQ